MGFENQGFKYAVLDTEIVDWCGWNPWVHYVHRATNWGKPQKNEGWKAGNNTQCDGNDEHGSQIPAFWNRWGLGIVISNAAKSAVIQQCDDHQHEHRQNEKTRPILVPWHNSCSQRIISFFAEDDTAWTFQGSIYLRTGTNNATLLEQNRPETCLKTENHPQTCFQRLLHRPLSVYSQGRKKNLRINTTRRKCSAWICRQPINRLERKQCDEEKHQQLQSGSDSVCQEWLHASEDSTGDLHAGNNGAQTFLGRHCLVKITAEIMLTAWRHNCLLNMPPPSSWLVPGSIRTPKGQ